MIATIWIPDPNPIGTESMFACCVVLPLLFLTSRISPLAEAWRRDVTLAAPLFLLIASAMMEGSIVSRVLFPRQFPDAADFAAAIIYDVAGLALAFKSLSYRGWTHQANAAVFASVYGLFIALRIAWWGPGHPVLRVFLFMIFLYAWLVVVGHVAANVGARRTNRHEVPASRSRRFQFSLRELLFATLVLAGVLGLFRMMSDWVSRCAVGGFDFMLHQELRRLNLGLDNAMDWLTDGRQFEKDNVDHYLAVAFPEWTSIDKDLSNAGYDVSRMDTSEALVFILAGLPDPKRPSGFTGLGPDPQQPLKPGAWRREHYEFDRMSLTDRDGDGWLEYTLRSSSSYEEVYSPKLFMIRKNEVVALDLHEGNGEAGMRRKMYRLEGPDLVTSEVPQSAISGIVGATEDSQGSAAPP